MILIDYFHRSIVRSSLICELKYDRYQEGAPPAKREFTTLRNSKSKNPNISALKLRNWDFSLLNVKARRLLSTLLYKLR